QRAALVHRDDDLAGPHRPRGELRTVEDEVRRQTDEGAVLQAGRLALGRVDDEGAAAAGVQRDRELAGDREAGAATASQPGAGQGGLQVLRVVPRLRGER